MSAVTTQPPAGITLPAATLTWEVSPQLQLRFNASKTIARPQFRELIFQHGGGIPLGYLLGDEQKLVIDPVTAPLVREIYQRYADGEIVRTIVEDFNRRGLKTKSGKPFSPNSFNRILKNRKYIGEYRYQDVIIPSGVPAILSNPSSPRRA